MSVGKDQNDALRIVIALVAVAIIVVAVYISKQREVSMGEDSGLTAPPSTTPGAHPAVTEQAPTQQFEAPQHPHQ